MAAPINLIPSRHLSQIALVLALALCAAAQPAAAVPLVAIADCIDRRRSPETRPSGRTSATGSAQSRSSPGSTSAMRRENTSPSSSELDASRLAPWTPEQATSPVA